MMSKNMPRATAAEKRRMDLFRVTGCMLTWLKFGRKVPAECQHIVMLGKRYGHWYTIPLSKWYHRGVPEKGRTKEQMRAEYGASLTDGRKAFVASHHYTEFELWQKFQVTMGFDDSLPQSKIVPRRLGGNRHDIAATDGRLVGISTGQADLPQARTSGAGGAVQSDARDAPEGRGDAGQVS
jgi:hypothetical protein